MIAREEIRRKAIDNMEKGDGCKDRTSRDMPPNQNVLRFGSETIPLPVIFMPPTAICYQYTRITEIDDGTHSCGEAFISNSVAVIDLSATALASITAISTLCLIPV